MQVEFRVIRQIRGAAISVINNIVEGSASRSNAEFICFLKYSCKSGAEIKNFAFVALDWVDISKNEFQEIYERGLKTIRIVDGFMRYARSHRSKHR